MLPAFTLSQPKHPVAAHVWQAGSRKLAQPSVRRYWGGARFSGHVPRFGSDGQGHNLSPLQDTANSCIRRGGVSKQKHPQLRTRCLAMAT